MHEGNLNKSIEYLWTGSVYSQAGTCGTRCPVEADGPLVDTGPAPYQTHIDRPRAD